MDFFLCFVGFCPIEEKFYVCGAKSVAGIFGPEGVEAKNSTPMMTHY